MTDESASTALPSVVDRAAFEAELDSLRVREKAHTREGDAIAMSSASAFVADLFLSRTLMPRLELQLSVENVFDARVEASATPVITVGQPRAVRVGIRYARVRA